MKDTKIYIILVLSVAFSMMFQSCGSSVGESLTLSKSKIESKLASEGELLMDNMIEAYKQVEEISFQSDYDGAVAGVLSSADKEFKPKQFLDPQSRQKINILYLYKQGLHEYSVLADGGFTGKQAAFANCSMAILDAFKELGDTVAYETVKPVANIVKSARYDENKVADYLSKGLGVVWNRDVEIWNRMLDSTFLEYQVNVANIPDDAFNEAKLSELVSQPYDGKSNLVKVYKLNLIKERRDQLNNFMKCQDNLTASLQYLGQALAEFQKKGFDKELVVNYLNRIQVMLDDNHIHYTENE